MEVRCNTAHIGVVPFHQATMGLLDLFAAGSPGQTECRQILQLARILSSRRPAWCCSASTTLTL